MINLNRTKSFLFHLKCSKIACGWGFAPNPAGRAYSALLDPLIVRGEDDGRRVGEGMGGREEGDIAILSSLPQFPGYICRIHLSTAAAATSKNFSHHIIMMMSLVPCVLSTNGRPGDIGLVTLLAIAFYLWYKFTSWSNQTHRWIISLVNWLSPYAESSSGFFKNSRIISIRGKIVFHSQQIIQKLEIIRH